MWWRQLAFDDGCRYGFEYLQLKHDRLDHAGLEYVQYEYVVRYKYVVQYGYVVQHLNRRSRWIGDTDGQHGCQHGTDLCVIRVG